MATDPQRPSSNADPNLVPDPATPAAGTVGGQDVDPARRDLRAEAGKYVSLVAFPATAEELIAAVDEHAAPGQVTALLRGLRPGVSFETPRDLWIELGLESNERF